jgi:hypothetical protein
LHRLRFAAISSITLNNTVKQSIILFTATVLFGCVSNDRKQEVFKTDKDFVEFWRLPSPDSSVILLNYGIDQGAFGYGHAGTSVLKLTDTTKNLRQFTLAYNLDRFKWLDNKTVSAKFDIIPSIRSGDSANLNDTVVNGIAIKVSSYDYIEPNAKQIIEYRGISPNGQHELIAYRYMNDEHNLNFIHVSIITPGGKIPKYGNYFIGDMSSDFILNGAWDKNNYLVFYSNNQYADMVQYYFVHNHPKIKYKVINDDKKYSGKYLWRGQNSR